MTATAAGAPRPRILLVEESNVDAETIDFHLGGAGMPHDLLRVRHGADFEQAIERAAHAEAAPQMLHLIVVGCSHADAEGLDAVATAKRWLPNVPVVLISNADTWPSEALRAGATDCVARRDLARLPGAVMRALAEVRERAQRKMAEAALVRSEAALRLAADAATLGSWHLHAGGGMHCDERCSAMLGVATGDNIDRKRFLDLIHAADRPGLGAAIDAALANDVAGVLACECRLAASAGDDVRWIALRGQHLGREAGGVLMTGVMQDLTSTRMTGSGTRHAELPSEFAVHATDLGVWGLGSEPDDVWIDDGCRRIAGLPADAHPGFAELLQGVVHPDDRPWLAAVIGNAIEGKAPGEAGSGDIDLEHRLIRADDGALRRVALKGRRVVGADGRHRLVGTLRDVTAERPRREPLHTSSDALERRVAERRWKLRAEIAERSRVEHTLHQMQRLEAVGQLTSGVAHDFNNLLTVVLSNISLISRLLQQQPSVDERVTRRLESMREAANRGSTLTRQLLAFSRRQRLAPQTIDFNDVVVGMRDLLQTTLGGSVHLETALAGDLWPAFVDPTQLELIILNLTINARDAMEAGGDLTVGTANVHLDAERATPEEPEPGDYVRLSVGDTGTGMSDEVLAKAFEPFFTTKDVGKGSGLGLAQVFGFAKQSSGGVRIDTTLGRGTTVHVFLPRSTLAALPHAAVADALPPGRGAERPADASTGRSLLLVDDDKAVREATASLLEIHGYRVTQTGDGASALALLQGGLPVDLVIADFAMPRMNGAQMAASIRQMRVELPVVFMTGYADLGALGHVPAHLVLQKPVGEMQLVARLRDVFVQRV